MMELINVCPFCQSAKLEHQLESKDHFLTKESFSIFKCSRCLIRFTNPRPDEKEVITYYLSNNYLSHGAKKNRLFDQFYLAARHFTLAWKVNKLRTFKENGRILDYGCGTGDFLVSCQKAGYSTMGVEPSERAKKFAEKKGQIVFSTLDELKEENFDIITLWHVLEHVHNVKSLIENLKNRLKKAGTLLIAVPNPESYDAVHYREYWAAYDLPRHLWHFDKPSMTSLLEQSGFILDEIVPMKLDSYYVSFLSSKYQHGSGFLNIFKGIFHGFLSNLKAQKNGEYSSLIYIAKQR